MNKPNLLPIIETLRTVEHVGKLDMDVAAVISDGEHQKYHECGTVHCIGGWYAVAKLQADPNHPLHANRYVDYDDGINMVNADAGVELNMWANDNPELWGNYEGCHIWANSDSWNDALHMFASGAPRSLTDVIHHLERVQDRIAGELL